MRIAIFSEAGFEYGFGHFYRMSGICDKAQREGLDVTMYLMADEKARANLRREYVLFAEWKEPAIYERILGDDVLLVIDSYHVDIELLERFNDLSNDMIVIDDNIRLDYHDMKVLNPNFFSIYLNYPENRNNTYYIGKDCTLMRDEIRMTGKKTVREKAQDVLITMGGTDPKGRTVQIINAIRQLDETVRLNVVCTKAYHNLQEIEKSLKETDKMHLNIDAASMCSLMNACDFAVASAGQTTNELIKMQCPAVLVVVADNQLLNTRLLSEAGYIEAIFDDDCSIIESMFSYEKRKQLANKLLDFQSGRSGKDIICELVRGGGHHE